MNPGFFATGHVARALRRILGSAEKGYEGVGNFVQKTKWPLWGAVAGAPVVGYQLDRLNEPAQPIPENNPELTQQRVEPRDMKTASAPEDEWLNYARQVIKQATAPLPSLAVKQALLDGMKLQIDQAKQRAKRMNIPSKPTSGFLDGEQQSQESGDSTPSVSNQPQYR